MQILNTSDYSLFKRISGNRVVNKAHVKKLAQSIAEDTELSAYVPVIVNDKMQVIDGQHRLEALKTLKLPIYYVKAGGLGLTDVQALNTRTKVWGPMDFAKSYAELNKKDYITYLAFRNKYKLPHNVTMSFLGKNTGGGGSSKEMFRNGKFKVLDAILAAQLCENLLKVSKYYPRAKSQEFALAFKTAFSHPKYSQSQLIEQMSKHPKLVHDCLSTEDYLRMLETLYNYHQKDESKRARFF